MSATVAVDVSDGPGSGSVTPPSSSSPSSSTSASAVPAVKAALLQWDVQLKLSPAQLSALTAFQQRLTPPPSSLPPPSHAAARPAPPPAGSIDSSQHKGGAANGAEGYFEKQPASESSLLLSLVPRLSLTPAPQPPPLFSHSAYGQALLSAYLTSSSSSTPFTSSYQLLCSASAHLHQLLTLSSSLLQHVALLHRHQATIDGQTRAVQEECTALLQQERELLAKAQRYADNLEFFTAADRIQGQLAHTLTITSSSTSSTSLDSAAFPSLLSTIDRCTLYLQHNPSFLASSLYLAKYERLKERLMRLLRLAVTDRLTEAEKTVRTEREKEKRGKGDVTPSPKGASALTSASPQSAWLRSFVQHRALAAELAPLLRDLEQRAADDTEKGLYSTTLQEVQSAYYQQRHRMVFTDLSQYVADLSRSMELTGLTRAAVAALTTLCSLETQLFDQLFTPASASLLSSLLSSLASVLYTALRPVIIRQTSIDVLCEVVIILEEETANDHAAAAAAATTAGEAYHTVLRRLINDCQERLSFRASVLIREEISAYKHREEDSDWRKRMARVEEARGRRGERHG